MAAAALFAAAPVTAETVVTLSGTRILHDPPFPEQLLPQYFAGDTIAHIDYPAAVFGMDASINVAATGIAHAVVTAPSPIVIAAFSQSAIAVAYEKQRLMSLPDAQRPATDQVSFVTIGDPAGPGGILRFLPFAVPILDLTPITAPQTPYRSLIVNGEYDGWGDFPDRPWNLISVANALLGIIYVHGRYETIPGGLDLSAVPTPNITISGQSTSYLIPTPKLPLVQPLRDIGVPEPFVAAIEKPLKAVVDAGYARNDAKPVAAQPVPAARRGAAADARPTAAGAARAAASTTGATRVRTARAANAA
jgi:hypothetical protein